MNESVSHDKRTETIGGLRALATFLEQRPDVPADGGLTLNVFAPDRETLARVARTGAWEKGYIDTWMWLRRDFGGGILIDINIARDQVCTRVVTGTRVVPAQDAVPERIEDVVEWVCDDAPLLATERSA